MPFDVAHGSAQTLKVAIRNRHIAAMTEQPPHTTCFVIVVDVKRPGTIRTPRIIGFTNRTLKILRFSERVVLVDSEPVLSKANIQRAPLHVGPVVIERGETVIFFEYRPRLCPLSPRFLARTFTRRILGPSLESPRTP